MTAIDADRAVKVVNEFTLFRCGEICAQLIMTDAGSIEAWLNVACTALAALPTEDVLVWGALLSEDADKSISVLHLGASESVSSDAMDRLSDHAMASATRIEVSGNDRNGLAELGLHNVLNWSISVSEKSGASTPMLIFEMATRRPEIELDAGVKHAVQALAAPMTAALKRYHLEPLRYRRALLSQLSPTQRRIAPLLAEGLTEREIADRLDRSPHTVHEHAKSIYSAWGVRSRFDLRDKWLQRFAGT